MIWPLFFMVARPNDLKRIYATNETLYFDANCNAKTGKFFKFDSNNLKKMPWDYLTPFWAMRRK
jgi:hypothetical protein